MSNYYIGIPHEDYVIHHGVLGMKWGVRRYQNADGSLTAEGRSRYGDGSSGSSKKEASLVLRDLGYKDTASARKYLIDNGIFNVD